MCDIINCSNTNLKKERKKGCMGYLCRWERSNEICVSGWLSRCGGCHSHDRSCWCGHGHGDRGLGHYGLLVLGHDGGHGQRQGWQVGHRWRGKLTEDFHIHGWEAILKAKMTDDETKNNCLMITQLIYFKTVMLH